MEEENVQKRSTGIGFHLSFGEVSARLIWLLPLAICVACSTTAADKSLVDRISVYTEADEITAKQARDDSCKQYDAASGEQLQILRNLNTTLDKAVIDRSPNSPEVEQAFEGVKNFNHDNVSRLEHVCKQATEKYARIIEVRADAARRASQIAEERSKRTINCTSTVAGTTVYTHCQ